MLQIVHFFINRPRSSFKLHFAACFSRCSGNKEKHQRIFYVCIVVLKGFSLKKNRNKKKTPINFGFYKMQVSFLFSKQLWDDSSRRWGGEKRPTQADMNDRTLTKIAVRVFHSAKIHNIHSVSSYLHERTRFTESVFLKPERLTTRQINIQNREHV